ncbi:hypothetical protein B0H10DRAFT_1849269 [Mycena sp. CBHHK59/15]|nr:hypothetical protein B0H10DRAFT_1849269 [Mycena sp. CBHHK59/15]
MSSKLEFCDVCVQAKAVRQPIPKVATHKRPTQYGGKVVTDLKGPLSVPSIKGAKYAMMFTDLATHEEKVQCVRLLLEVRGLGKTVHVFTMHLEKVGTICNLTIHNTPSENGVAE